MNNLSRKYCKMQHLLMAQYSDVTIEAVADILLSQESICQKEQTINKILNLVEKKLPEKEFIAEIKKL